ncbi:MAG: hypothetical protein LBB50_06225 [Oscillospiraceae bacterium]|jgi:hypothetical protein|nr:hypothetical protein [Oscillospiraceae bacterium]
MCANCSIPISLSFDPRAAIHISQILAGFHLLAQSGWCTLTVRQTRRDTSHFHYVLAETAGKSIVFDVHDNGRQPPVLPADHYFRRSACTPQEALGLNYHVSCPGNPYQTMVPAGCKDPAARHVLLRKALAHLPAGSLSDRWVYPGQIAQPAGHPQEESILFLTRTWFPLEEHPGLREEQIVAAHPQLALVLQMDETRAALIRLLRREYGRRAVCGFARTPFAVKHWPSLVVPHALTQKRAYLAVMRRARVCLTTTGLHGSTGWKFGEYAAAAKAFVAEPPQYHLPGGFAANANYLPFHTPEQALSQTEHLRADAIFREEMQRRNAAYYQAFLRPDILVKNALARALE